MVLIFNSDEPGALELLSVFCETVANTYISKGRCILLGGAAAENKHLMLLLCKWVDCVYSAGPVSAELDSYS